MFENFDFKKALYILLLMGRETHLLQIVLRSEEKAMGKDT